MLVPPQRPNPRQGLTGDSSEINYSDRATMVAWEGFLSRGRFSPGTSTDVRTLIQASWQRSSSAGINAETREAPLLQDTYELDVVRHGSHDLIEAAKTPFAQLGSLLFDCGAMLILTDADGLIIDTIGDPQTLNDGRRINLEVGGLWNEAIVGTNGIGTALWTGEPIFVHAGEHFCSGLKSWTCAGAPIRDPLDRRVIGLIDLSGRPSIFQRHNTALVAAAAREIQETLAKRQRKENSRLMEAFLNSVHTWGPEDGVVILDRSGRVVYTRNTGTTGLTNGPDIDFEIGMQLVEMSETTAQSDIADTLSDGLDIRDVRTLRFESRFCGAAVILRGRETGSSPVSRPQKFAATLDYGDATTSLVGRSKAFLEAIELAKRVADTTVSVLVTGETGVGKELFARLIHSLSTNGADAPYIDVNCGAVAKELFGAELFGHVAGAFTGAVREGKPGKFELADGGILCLDEIGEMPLDLQPYLLRVLEERAVYRVGDNKRRKVDVRLISLTNRDLKTDIEVGKFRRDLFYRIGTVTIHVPPLRERGGDIDLLIDYFNETTSQAGGEAPMQFPEATREVLRTYPWPGNVRELRNLIEQLNLLSKDRHVRPGDLPPEFHVTSKAGTEADAGEGEDSGLTRLEVAERDAIKQALVAKNGNLTRVAKSLGISRPTLYRKMQLYDIRRVYE